MKPKIEILLDMDGVLADFFSLAFEKCFQAGYATISQDEYISLNMFNMAEVFGISQSLFWQTIDNNGFWNSLKPMPGCVELVDRLKQIGRVTIASSPSLNRTCIMQKLQWLETNLGISVDECMFGSRKELMASPNTVLIDDYPGNISKFTTAGGLGILVPSNWNTPRHLFTPELVLEAINKELVFSK